MNPGARMAIVCAVLGFARTVLTGTLRDVTAAAPPTLHEELSRLVAALGSAVSAIEAFLADGEVISRSERAEIQCVLARLEHAVDSLDDIEGDP